MQIKIGHKRAENLKDLTTVLKKLDVRLVADELLLISDTYFITRYVKGDYTFYVHYSADATLLNLEEVVEASLDWISQRTNYLSNPVNVFTKWFIFKICIYQHESEGPKNEYSLSL